MRSASAIRALRPRARSMVTWWPPSAKPSAWTKRPPREHRDRGGAGAHVDDGGAEIGLVVGQRARARPHRGSPPSPRRRDGSARPPASGCAPPTTSAVTTCMSTPKLRASMPRGSRMPRDVVERIADRQRMQHGAAGAHRMAAAGGQHAGDVAVGDGRSRRRRSRPTISSLAGAPGRDRDDDRFELQPARCARRDRRPGAPPPRPRRDRSRRRPSCRARAVWPKPMTSTRVAAPAQHVLRRLRLEPRDQADDLAGADVERRDERRALAATPASSSA